VTKILNFAEKRNEKIVDQFASADLDSYAVKGTGTVTGET
jgi:hypothetical protein